jgi:hypothetical protein
MAAKVKLYCELMRGRLNDLSFEQKREVLDALQAQFTLDKDGELRIVLVLPSVSETGESYTTCDMRRGIHGAKSYTGKRHAQSDSPPE